MPERFDNSQIKSKLGWSNSFDRNAAYPLDASSWFGSLAEAQAAAQTAVQVGSTDSKYYFGQQLYVFDGVAATTYLIQGDKTLKEIGSSSTTDVSVDNASIVLSDGGILSLKNFNTNYYAYDAETDSYYEVKGSFKQGLIPKTYQVSENNYELVWYEPSTKLETELAKLKESVYTKTEIDNMLSWLSIE